jgi:hypothetical protein
MPRATVNIQEAERVELKTLPEGFVTIRRLSYGQKLERRAMSSQASAEMQGGNRRNMKLVLDMINERAMLFDFTHCIIDHNLEDENGNRLDLSNPNHVRLLDPRVGEEIERALDRLNNFEEDDEELGN